MLLNLSPDAKTLKELQSVGVDGKSMDNRTALTYALIKKAMKYGNVLALYLRLTAELVVVFRFVVSDIFYTSFI